MDYDYDLVSGKVNYVYYQKDKGDQFIHKYTYDGDNRLNRTETSTDGKVWIQEVNYQYYPHGPLSRTELGEQKVETQNYAYTLQGWIKAMSGQDFSYALGYNNADYDPIAQGGTQLTTPVESTKQLFNGNIATMASQNSTGLNGTLEPAWTQQFRYDHLNRITSSSTLGDASRFATSYSYDPNGNIKTLTRKDASGGLFDNMSYAYADPSTTYSRYSNRLTGVTDGVTSARLDDIESQATDNYGYDEIGNLAKDALEKIKNIEWSNYGKVQRVTRESNSGKADLQLIYDAVGNRVVKKSTIPAIGTSPPQATITYYIRDIVGNTISIYEKTNGSLLEIKELYIYGHNRIGQFKENTRSYELTDHLGNVRAVISDKPGINLAAFDFYPYGMIAKRLESSEVYRYSYNGKEKVSDWSDNYDFGARIFDSKIARFLSIDPLTIGYPSQSAYVFGGSNPIFFIDSEGMGPTLPISPTNEFGERQVYTKQIYSGGTSYGFGVYSSVKVIPEGKPATQGMSEKQIYQMAVRRVFMPGMSTIPVDMYIDEKLIEAEQNIRTFFSSNIPGYAKSTMAQEKIKEEVHTNVLNGLFEDEGALGSPEDAIDLVKRSGSLLWNYSLTDIAYLVPTERINSFLRGASKHIGTEYENFLAKRMGGKTGTYIKGTTGGRDIDVIVGNWYIEAKSGGYWAKIMTDPKAIQKFKSDMMRGKKAVHDVTGGKGKYVLFSNSKVPDTIKSWLKSKEILVQETLK